MNDRHAYMIMAHHRADLLQLLLDALDDERNDIIVHLDSKSNLESNQFSVKKANIVFVERINVKWAGYSQVDCTFRLLKTALGIGNHTYYHFLTGANYPLWNQNYIHNFFQEYKGKEFVGFDHGMDFAIRTRYFIPFSEYGKLTGIRGHVINTIRKTSVAIQKMFKVDRNNKHSMQIKKGCAYFSITEQLAEYIVSKEEEMKKLLKHTIWCDEVFVQTITYNSDFRKNLFDEENEFDGCLREFAWPSNIEGDHPGWNYSKKDLDFLLKSKRLFAMKFESPDGIDTIKEIRRLRGIV